MTSQIFRPFQYHDFWIVTTDISDTIAAYLTKIWQHPTPKQRYKGQAFPIEH